MGPFDLVFNKTVSMNRFGSIFNKNRVRTNKFSFLEIENQKNRFSSIRFRFFFSSVLVRVFGFYFNFYFLSKGTL